MAQVLALHLNPGWAAGAALQTEPQEGARLPGLTNPSLGTLGAGGFHSVGWREAKSPTVPTEEHHALWSRSAPPQHLPDRPGPHLGGRYGHRPAARSQESRHSGRSPRC